MNAIEHMPHTLAYLLIVAGMAGLWIPAIRTFSRRNAYRTDGFDTLGGVIRRWADRRVQAHRAVARGYAERADEQHRKFLDGDPDGMFGEYPPHHL